MGVGDAYVKRDVHGKIVYVCRGCGTPIGRGSLSAHAVACARDRHPSGGAR